MLNTINLRFNTLMFTHFVKIMCIVMVLVKNMWLKVTVRKVVDMNKVKNDAHNVKCSLNGKACGVLAVDVC